MKDMRKIRVGKWIERVPDDSGKVTEREATTMTLLGVLINLKKPEEMPRGFDKFRMFNKIMKAFDKADGKEFLELEDAEYIFLKKLVENDIPAAWGARDEIMAAVGAFMEAKDD